MEYTNILGHVFQTEEQAQEAVQQLNEYHGLAKEDCISKFDNNTYKEHPDGFYYILFSNKWNSILGTPVEISIEIKP